MLLCLPGTPWAADAVFNTGQSTRLPAIALIIDDLEHNQAFKETESICADFCFFLVVCSLNSGNNLLTHLLRR